MVCSTVWRGVLAVRESSVSMDVNEFLMEAIVHYAKYNSPTPAREEERGGRGRNRLTVRLDIVSRPKIEISYSST